MKTIQSVESKLVRKLKVVLMDTLKRALVIEVGVVT